MGSLNLSSESVSHEMSAQSSHLNIHVIPEDTEKISRSSFALNEDLKAVDFPSSLKKISDKAFLSCRGLKQVDLSKCEKLETIEESAFKNCTKLKEIDLSNCINLEEIGDKAFYGCTSLESITFPDSLESIGWAAFAECTSLESITFPDSLESIGRVAFSGCTSLESITFPDSLESIGGNTFCDCTSLKKIDLSNCINLEEIGEKAFYGCTSLETVIFPSSLKTIRKSAFECTGLIEIVIPDTVENVEYRAFRNIETLEKATIGRSVKEGNWIFQDTPNLKELTFRSEVAIFTGAAHLTKVTFADTVKELGVGTVAKCEELEEIIIPDSITKIDDEAFEECTKLKEIVFPSALQKLGWLGTDLAKLKKLDFSKVTKLKVIPEGFIGDNTPKLKEIALPIGVTTIEENIGGENLKRLFLPPTIQEVENLHQFNIDIYCFSPAIEELEPIAEDIDEEEKAIRLYVLPEYLESYKAQREAERINEKFLIIDVIPEEYRYFYDK